MGAEKQAIFTFSYQNDIPVIIRRVRFTGCDRTLFLKNLYSWVLNLFIGDQGAGRATEVHDIYPGKAG